MNYGWRFVTLYRRQGSRPFSKEEMQKSKLAVKKRSENQRRKGKISPSECRVPKNSKER